MGHWHLVSKDPEANKKLFLAMGGRLYMPGGQPLIAFPGVIPVIQFFLLRSTKPSNYSILHGYLLTTVTAGAIALMTTDLGGFNSSYYAGLNLVILAIVVLLPWGAVHSIANSTIVLGLYIGLNLIFRSPEPVKVEILFNNLYAE